MSFLRSIWRLFIATLAAFIGAILGLIAYSALVSPFTINGVLISMGIGAVFLGGLSLLYPKPIEFILDVVGIAADP